MLQVDEEKILYNIVDRSKLKKKEDTDTGPFRNLGNS